MKYTCLALLLCYALSVNGQSIKDYKNIGRPYHNLFSNFSGKIDTVSNPDGSLKLKGFQPLLLQHVIIFVASTVPKKLSIAYIDKKGSSMYNRDFDLAGKLLAVSHNEQTGSYKTEGTELQGNPATNRNAEFEYDKQNKEFRAQIPLMEDEEENLTKKDVFLLYQLYDESGSLIGQGTNQIKSIQDISSPSQDKYYKLKEGVALLKEKRKTSAYFK